MNSNICPFCGRELTIKFSAFCERITHLYMRSRSRCSSSELLEIYLNDDRRNIISLLNGWDIEEIELWYLGERILIKDNNTYKYLRSLILKSDFDKIKKVIAIL